MALRSKIPVRVRAERSFCPLTPGVSVPVSAVLPPPGPVSIPAQAHIVVAVFTGGALIKIPAGTGARGIDSRPPADFPSGQIVEHRFLVLQSFVLTGSASRLAIASLKFVSFRQTPAERSHRIGFSYLIRFAIEHLSIGRDGKIPFLSNFPG